MRNHYLIIILKHFLKKIKIKIKNKKKVKTKKYNKRKLNYYKEFKDDKDNINESIKKVKKIYPTKSIKCKCPK